MEPKDRRSGTASLLLRCASSALAYTIAVGIYAYWKRGELPARKTLAISAVTFTAGLVVFVYQWVGKKSWSWFRTFISVMVVTLILIGLSLFAIRGRL